MLEHVASNKNVPKRSLSRATGRRLCTLFLDTVLNRRPVVVICVQKCHFVYASKHHAPDVPITAPPGALFRPFRARRVFLPRHLMSEIPPFCTRKKPAPDEAGFWLWIPSLTLGMTGAFPYAFAFCLISAWAAARRAMGTRNGEQET